MTRLKPEGLDEYRLLHAAVWPEVLGLLKQARIENYSIWLHEDELTLFASFDYRGIDFQADMSKVASDPVGARWAAVTGACQLPMGRDGTPWLELEEVFRLD